MDINANICKKRANLNSSLLYEDKNGFWTSTNDFTTKASSTRCHRRQ